MGRILNPHPLLTGLLVIFLTTTSLKCGRGSDDVYRPYSIVWTLHKVKSTSRIPDIRVSRSFQVDVTGSWPSVTFTFQKSKSKHEFRKENKSELVCSGERYSLFTLLWPLRNASIFLCSLEGKLMILT